MFQVQLINTVVEWERKLQMEEEKRNNLKGKPYENITTASKSSPIKRQFSLTQNFRHGKANQPVCCYTFEQCADVKGR